MTDDRLDSIKNASEYIKNIIKTDRVDIGIILGTNLSGFANALNGEDILYKDIPDFPHSSLSNDEGKLTYALIADKKTLCFQRRLHYYEGYPIDQVVFPVRVMKEFGVNTLIITNSSGTLSAKFNPGDIMIITDHINLMGVNPLVGKNLLSQGKKFIDMSEPYSKRLISLLKNSSPVSLKEGIYIGVSGPNYETPAEVTFFSSIGGSVVGMSTVPETIVAKSCGIETAGLSCISNYASGIHNGRLNHDEVIEIAKKTETNLISVILNLIAVM